MFKKNLTGSKKEPNSKIANQVQNFESSSETANQVKKAAEPSSKLSQVKNLQNKF